MKIFAAISALVLAGHATGVGATETKWVAEHGPYEISDGKIVLTFDESMHSTVRKLAAEGGADVQLGAESKAHSLTLADGTVVSDFTLKTVESLPVSTEIGDGQRHRLRAMSSTGIELVLAIDLYNEFRGVAVTQATYTNKRRKPVKVQQWTHNAYAIPAADTESPLWWSFQGATHQDRRDWIQSVTPGYNQANFMGMNASDYGGGTPVSDVWRRDGGLAVGHLETTPKLVGLPTSADENAANVALTFEALSELKRGEKIETFLSFVSVHEGDFFGTLRSYSDIMAKRGLAQPEFPDTSYEAIWCAWGYERGFSVEEILGTLPKVKEMGLKWAVLDDGWQTAEGDWYLNPEKFPNGDEDMIAFVEKINEAGLQAKLWIAPLAVDPGTDLLRDNTDMLLLDEWGAVHDVTWWNSFYLCPAYGPTIEQAKSLVRKIMGEWGYAGLKIDGQHLNGVAPCHNPAHNHDHPNDSIDGLQDFWKAVFEEAKSINPDAVIEICPCGTSYAFHNTPYMNQTVASDPLSSWQIRHKGKTLKALTGVDAPYYADHVELSDDASDFATAIGIGAIVGTKFTWPQDNHPELGYQLTRKKEKRFKKWISLYNELMLSKGHYRGELYDIGFDVPETHVVEKDGKMYYAFYAEEWSGAVDIRGLGDGQFELVNYVDNERPISIENGRAELKFEEFLLLEARPLEN